MGKSFSRRGWLKAIGWGAAGAKEAGLRSAAATALTGCGTLIKARTRKPIEVKLPGNKKIEVVFRLAPHHRNIPDKEFGTVVKKVKPHVVCLEAALETHKKAVEFEEHYRKGPINEEGQNAHTRHILEVLRRNKVERVFSLERLVDEKKADELLRGFFDSNRSEYLADGFFLRGDPYTAINFFTESVKYMIEVQPFREAEVKRVMSRLYEHLIKRYPELAKEKSIRVVIKYGGLHTHLYEAAKKQGFGSVKRSQEKPTYFDWNSALQRAACFGLPVKTDRNTMARTMLASLIIEAIREKTGIDVYTANAFSNSLTRRIDFKEFSRICELVAERFYSGDSQLPFWEGMKKAGYYLPETKAEVEDYLRKKQIADPRMRISAVRRFVSIGDARSIRELQRELKTETHPKVRSEIEKALRALLKKQAA